MLNTHIYRTLNIAVFLVTNRANTTSQNNIYIYIYIYNMVTYIHTHIHTDIDILT